MSSPSAPLPANIDAAIEVAKQARSWTSTCMLSVNTLIWESKRERSSSAVEGPPMVS